MAWQPPGHPYTVTTHQVPPRASEISQDGTPRSTHSAHNGMFYPPINPSAYVPSSLSGQQSAQLYQNADAYTFVDQVGNVQTVPVVSRSQVLTEIRYKQPPATAISGTELQNGADASPHRINSTSSRNHRQRSNTNTSSSSNSNSQRPGSESVLQHWLVPDNRMRYWALWTSIFTLAASFIFAFMAGNFAVYQQSPTFKQYNQGGSEMPVQLQWGPEALKGWLKFWTSSPMYSFEVGYLMNWGARYLPAIAAGEWWRLFSSICIHGSFAHLFSNMLVFVVLAVPLEHSYGPFRIFAIFLASGFGGTFLSMAFEDPCHVYVGASGAVFGFIGLYLADIILNFESMYKPLLRLALMVMSLGLTLGIEFAAAQRNPLQRVSHMSHIGGLAAGLFVSFMFIPNLADRRWKAARKFAQRISTSIHNRLSHGGGTSSAGQLPSTDLSTPAQSCWRRNAWLYYLMWLLSACVMMFMFVGLPVYAYTFKMPRLQCPPLVPAGV